MATRGLGTLTIDLIAKTGGFTQGLDRAQRAMRDATRGMSDDAKKSADEITKVFSGAVGHINKLLGGLAAAVSFDKTVRAIVGFEDSMLRLQATSRSTTEEMKALENQARSLGATTRYSAQQAADAQNFLAMAGFSTSDILAATGDVINFASAASIDLARSADIASNVLGQMRLPVSQLSRAMDVMVNTTQSSNTNIEQLAEAMSYAGPIAASAGVSVEELAAAIGVLGDSAIQGSRAGTGIVGIIAQLSNLTPNATAALAKYGLTADDVNIQVHGLATVMERLQGLSVADSLLIFGREAATAAEIIAVGADRMNELAEANANVAGRTKEVATLLDQGLSAAFASVLSALEETMLQVGEAGLGGALKTIAITTAGVINEFNGLLPLFAESSGISEEFAKNIKLLADAIKVAGTVAVSVIGGRMVVALGASALSFAAATVEAMRYQATLASMAGVSASAAAGITALSAVARAAAGALSVFGGPAGLIAAVAIGTTVFTQFGQSTKETGLALSDLGDDIDQAKEKFKELEVAAQGALLASLAADIREQTGELRSAAAQAAEALTDEFSKASYQIGVTARDLGSNAGYIATTFKQAAAGMSVDWNELTKTILNANDITEQHKERLLSLVGQMHTLDNSVRTLSVSYDELNTLTNENANLTEEEAAAKRTAQAATQAATLATNEFIAKLEEEAKRMEDSIKTTRQLAAEYIKLHGLQGGDVDRIMEAVARHEQAAKSVENHRESMRKLRSTSKNTTDELKKLIEQLLPLEKATNDYEKSVKVLDAGLRAGKLSAQQHGQALAELRKRYTEAVIANTPHIKSIQDQIQAIKNANDQLQAKIKAHGRSEAALASEALAETRSSRVKLESAKATAKATGAKSAYIKELELEINKLKELESLQTKQVALLRQSDAIDNYKQMAEEAKHVNDEIGQSLTDALMRAFESGKGFADAMKTTVMNMFKTMVLQPIIQPVMVGTAEMITGAFGGTGGTLSSGLGMINNIKTIANAFSGSLVSSLGSGIASLGSAFGSSAMTSFAAGMKGASLAPGLMGPTTAGASGAMGAGAAFGAALPWLAGGIAVASLLPSLNKMFKGETRVGGGFRYSPETGTTSFYGGPSGGYGGKATIDAVTQLFGSTVDTINSVIQGVGAQAEVAFFHGGFESSGKGRGGTFSGGEIMLPDGTRVSFGTHRKGQGYGGRSGSAEQMFDNLTKDVYYSTLEAWQMLGDQMPALINDMLSGVNVRSLSVEQAQAAVEQIQAVVMQVNALSDALSALPFNNLTNLSFDLTAALLQAAGSIDELIGNLSVFYSEFYSEAERSAIATEQFIGQMTELGLAVPTTAKEFRDLVNSIEITDQASADLYTSLIGLSGAAAQFYQSIEAQAQESAEAAIEEAKRAYDEMVLLSRDAYNEQVKNVRDSYNSQTKAIRESIASVNEKIRELQSLANSLESSLASLRSVSDETQTAIREQSRATVKDALALARAGQSLVGFAGLEDAVKSLGDLTTDTYTSWQDYERERLTTIHDLAELAGYTETQLDVQDLQLEALNIQLEQLEVWRDEQLELAEKTLEDQLAKADEIFELEKSLAIKHHNEVLAEMLKQNEILLAQMSANRDNTRALLNEIGSPGSIRTYPQFADGGHHLGGGRIVGEFGAEFEVTGAARYYNAQQTQELIRQSIRSGDRHMQEMTDTITDGLHSVGKIMDEILVRLEKWDMRGLPETREVY